MDVGNSKNYVGITTTNSSRFDLANRSAIGYNTIGEDNNQ